MRKFRCIDLGVKAIMPDLNGEKNIRPAMSFVICLLEKLKNLLQPHRNNGSILKNILPGELKG
jgi:hypothetical protein